MPMDSTTPQMATATERLILQACEHLREGRIVGLPTETVYALAAMLSAPAAIAQLKTLKQISGPPNWVIHVADSTAVKRIVADVPAIAQRLMKKLWPGPLAIELPASPADVQRLTEVVGAQAAAECITNGFMTFRCPQNPSTLAVLASVSHPVVMIGAGNARAIQEAADIPENIRSVIPLVVDTGPTRYRKASTLVRVRDDQMTFLREGMLARRIIERMTDQVVLFLCSGNTCRSPMAAGIAAVRMAKKLGTQPADLPLRHIVVESAGLYAGPGAPATPDAVKAAGIFSADISRHRSRSVTVDMLRRADLIYTMTSGHRADVLAMLPDAGAKTFTLDPDADIVDPIGAGYDQYLAVARRMDELIKTRLAEILP